MIAIGAGIAALACIRQVSVSVSQQVKQQRQSQDSRKQRARSPRSLLLGGALAEATAIYGFVIGIPDHSVHGITIRSRKRHRQASNACICKLFCDDLRRLKLHKQKKALKERFANGSFG